MNRLEDRMRFRMFAYGRIFWGIVFLWMFALGARKDAWFMVAVPLLGMAATLIWSETLKKQYPELAPKLLMGATFFGGIFALSLSLPRAYETFKSMIQGAEVRFQLHNEPSLLALQQALTDYVAQTGDADGRLILQDLDRLRAKHEAHTFSLEDQKEEDALFLRAQELARRNTQLKDAVGLIPRVDANQNQSPIIEFPKNPSIPKDEATLVSSTAGEPPAGKATATPMTSRIGAWNAGEPPGTSHPGTVGEPVGGGAGSDSPKTPSQASEQVVEKACRAPLPQPIQFGDSSFTLTNCGIRGNQVRLSGKIQYDGVERVNMFFHPFKAYDDSANLYIVQEGRFGSSQSFGTGHSGQWMDPHTSIPFLLVIGPKDGGLPPTTALTLDMPCSDLLGGHVRLSLTLR